MKRILAIASVVSTFLVIGCATQPQQSTKPAKSESQTMESPANPFLEEWTTPFGVPPFDRIENHHYLPAFEAALEAHNKEINAIVNNPDAPTFENTIAALDASGSLLSRVARVFYGLLSARTDDEMNGIAQKVSPLLTNHEDSIRLNEALFARIKTVHDQVDKLELTAEQATLVEEFYQDFVRGGANLSPEEKQVLREINRFEMVIDDENDLAGLPLASISAAASAANQREYKGKWLFTLHKPSLIPFLQYSERRELREKMFKGYINQGANGDELDKRKLSEEIVALRTDKANLMGYDTFADFALSRRVAKNPANVYELLLKLWKPALARAKTEADDLQQLIDIEKGGFKLEAWD